MVGAHPFGSSPRVRGTRLQLRPLETLQRFIPACAGNTVLPLAGTLWEIIERRLEQRRLDCPFVFHYRNGKKVGDFRKVWAKACKTAGLTGVIPHDLRRCAARNLSLSGVKEQLAMKITGHTTNIACTGVTAS
jgi:integrase